MGNLHARVLDPGADARRAADAGRPAAAPAPAGREPHRLPRHLRRGRPRRRTPARTAAPRCSSAATKKTACAASTTAGSSTSTGACVDMPSEPAESNFKTKVRVTRLPLRRAQRHHLDLHGPARDAAAAARAAAEPRRRTARVSRRLRGVQLHAGPRRRHRHGARRLPARRPRRPPTATAQGSADYYAIKQREARFDAVRARDRRDLRRRPPGRRETPTTGASATSCCPSTR